MTEPHTVRSTVTHTVTCLCCGSTHTLQLIHLLGVHESPPLALFVLGWCRQDVGWGKRGQRAHCLNDVLEREVVQGLFARIVPRYRRPHLLLDEREPIGEPMRLTS